MGHEDGDLITVSGVVADLQTAAQFPMRCDGNLVPPPGKIGGEPVEVHWAALVTSGIDLDIDSNNNSTDGIFGGPDRDLEEDRWESAAKNSEGEDLPGKYIPVNDGDEDNDEIPGYADGFAKFGDDSKTSGGHFVKAILDVSNTSEMIEWSRAKIKFKYSSSPPDKVEAKTYGADANSKYYTIKDDAETGCMIRIWTKDADKQRDPKTFDLGGDYIPGKDEELYADNLFRNEQGERTTEKTIYIEGIGQGTTSGLIEVKFSPRDNAPWMPDEVRVTVVHIDTDVDSNNDEGTKLLAEPNDCPERLYEDTIEAAAPGKCIPINDGDFDGDKITDFADFKIAKNRQGKNLSFTPLILEIPKPLDMKKLSLKITYTASDPNKITKTGDGQTGYIYTPALGTLRLWKKNADKSRRTASARLNSNGDWIAPGEYDNKAVQRLFGDNRSLTLWGEGTYSGRDSITVELDPDGAGPAKYVHKDTVSVLAGKIDLDVDSDNTDGYNDQWTRTTEEDAMEDLDQIIVGGKLTDNPGKIFQVNDGDADEDGIPDFADGFDITDKLAEDNMLDADPADNPEAFGIPIVLVADIKGDQAPDDLFYIFEYKASDPKLTSVEEEEDEDGNKTYSFSAPAGFRIWTNKTKTRNKGKVNGSGTEKGDFVPTSYVGVCTPRPQVKLQDVTESDVKIKQKQGVAVVTLKCDEVLDPVADNIPRGVADIANVEVFVAGSESPATSANVRSVKADAPTFWRQHPYKGKFSNMKVEIPLVEGTHNIRVQTSENAAELTGFDDVDVTLSREIIPGSGGGTATFIANIYMPQEITNTSVDTVKYYFENRDPLDTDPVFAEKNDWPESSEFYGKLNDLDAKIAITNFPGLTNKKDTLTAEIPVIVNSQIVHITAEFTETKKDSRIFRKTVTYTIPPVSSTVKWKVANISNKEGNDTSYLPGTVRIKGLSPPVNFVAKLDEDTTFNLEEKDGWLYLKGGSQNMVFQIYQNGKVVRVFYDEKGKIVIKKEMVDFINIYNLTRKDDPDFSTMGKIFTNVVMIGIDGDYNREGIPIDDDNKYVPVDFLKDKGMVTLVNCDDDNDDKKPDGENDTIDGGNDRPDMSPLNIYIRNRKFVNKSKKLFAGLEVELSVISPENRGNAVRIFPQPNDLNKKGYFKFSTKDEPDWLKSFLSENKLPILAEGLDFSREFIIKAEWRVKPKKGKPGYSLGFDEVRGLTSPWIGLSNAAKVNKVYACNNSDVFLVKCREFFGNNLINDDWAVFTQDLGEFGFTACGKDINYRKVILNTGARSNFSSLISKDIGYLEVKELKTEDGGTIDFIPPSNDNKRPFGRILFGYISDLRHKNAVDYLNRQKVQGEVITVDTSWLQVGHLDEIVAIIPYGGSFKIVIGDLKGAIDLIKKGDENDPVIKEWLDHYKQFPTKKDKIIASLDNTADIINKALKDNYSGYEIIRIPVLYNCEPKGSGVFGSNSVNMTIANINGTIKVLVPDAFHFSLIKDAIAEKLKFLGKPSINGNWDWIDTEILLGRLGEAHCATNTEKEPK